VNRLAPTIEPQQHYWPGYASAASKTAAWRERIKAYFIDQAPDPHDLDFDRIRPRATT
jgi:hypothetical protein